MINKINIYKRKFNVNVKYLIKQNKKKKNHLKL